MESATIQTQKSNPNQEKILLLLLPFWTPLIPPMGICILKRFLEDQGYQVRTDDANIHPELWETYHTYFDKIKEFIPKNNWGNFYNHGNKVFKHHLMAHFNYQDETQYQELVKILVSKFYYYELNKSQIIQLNEMIQTFYVQLEKYLLEMFDQERPDVLGISVFEGSLAPSMFAFKWAKEKYPAIRTIMGGGIFADEMTKGSPNLEFFVEKAPFIDQVVIGEGQKPFLKFLRGELPKGQRVVSLHDLQEDPLSFNDVKLPDYSDLKLDTYPYIGATGSKSCPYQCSFCNVTFFWGKHQKKDPKQTVAEMTELYQKYGFQVFFMTDSLLNTIASEIATEFIKTGLILYWDGYCRVDEASCDPESVFLWRRGGFYRARLGVESGSQHVLDLMKKNITPQQIKQALSNLANAGIKTTTYWVIGHPGETESDFQQTLDLITEIKDYIWQAECNPFYYNYCAQGSADEWAPKRILVFPETAKEMLISQTWDVGGEPSREEIYRRVYRFTEHCERLGIPNPYTLKEVYAADERWRTLHKNAVPSLIKFQGGAYINENMQIKKLIRAETTGLDADNDFNF